MRQYVLEIAYDGGAFRGWQSQPCGRGVQDSLERALRELKEKGRPVGAGRTDAGVHARAQIAGVRLSRDWEPRRLLLALNAKLPPSVSVIRTALAPPGFHARASALSRTYRYFIWNSSTCYPHIRPYVLWQPGEGYDWRRARGAVRLFEGPHDFRAFCRTEECPGNTIRTVLRARLKTRGRLVVFSVEADSFLTNMIRIMVGSLLEIAKGRRDEEWLETLLDGVSTRAMNARTASPAGLFFWRAGYPFAIDWCTASGTREGKATEPPRGNDPA